MPINFLGLMLYFYTFILFLANRNFEHFVENPFLYFGELSETLLMLMELCFSEILHIWVRLAICFFFFLIYILINLVLWNLIQCKL